MRVRICVNSRMKGVEDQRIVITVAGRESYDAPVKQIKDGTEIDLPSWSTSCI